MSNIPLLNASHSYGVRTLSRQAAPLVASTMGTSWGLSATKPSFPYRRSTPFDVMGTNGIDMRVYVVLRFLKGCYTAAARDACAMIVRTGSGCGC